MPSKKNVGTSIRTPFKHALLNGVVGKVVGSLCSGGVGNFVSKESIVFIDMCAGDGLETEEHKSSPSIMLKHAAYCAGYGRARYPVPPSVHFIEKKGNTIDALRESIGVAQPFPVYTHHMDAADFHLPIHDPRETRIINIDPNAITGIPSPNAWGPLLTETSFLMMTLGCNADGVKRLPLERRKEWFDYVGECETWFRRHHERFDLFFVSLTNDSHQWAYLFNFPVAWREDMAKGLSVWSKKVLPDPYGLDVKCYRTDTQGFRDEVYRHFLTKTENARRDARC